MTTITASTIIDGITVSVSAQFCSAGAALPGSDPTASCEDEYLQGLRVHLAQGIAAALVQAELEVSRSLLAAARAESSTVAFAPSLDDDLRAKKWLEEVFRMLERAESP